MDDLGLMRLEADTGFTHDARGRMLASNEPRTSMRRPAPRLYVGRTMAGHVLRFGAGVPDALAEELTAVMDGGEAIDALPFPPALRDTLRTILERYAPVIDEGEGPAYRFPETLSVPADVVHVTEANRGLARETFPWLYRFYADWQRCFVRVLDGAAVSVCFSSRVGDKAEAAGVSTRPEFRGRGYAAAVTAAWGVSVRTAGRIPFYGTSWDNVASQGVARRVGLVMYGTTLTLG
jgi:RimJ/RimL family protein N-acetyltransferase